MKFGWLMKTDWRKKLSGDYLDIAELIGIENLIKMLDFYQKTHVYFATAPLNDLLRSYILDAEDVRVRDLARETGKSERSIQRMRRRAGKDGLSA